MKKWIEKAKTWKEKRSRETFARNFQSMMQNQDSWQAKTVNQAVQMQVSSILRGWLSAHSFSFCARCLETKSLRVNGNHYLCEKCFQEVVPLEKRVGLVKP